MFLNIANRITNNIYAPIAVICDKLCDISYELKKKDYCIDLEAKQNKDVDIVRLFPKKSVIENYFNFVLDPTLVYTDKTTQINLYLGSAYNSACYYTLKKYNIKYIINVSIEISNYYPGEIVYYNIPIKDNNNESINEYLTESHIKIKEFIENKNGNILVHCYMGASRSATVVTNFIAKETNKDITRILEELIEKRSIINLTEKLVDDLINN